MIPLNQELILLTRNSELELIHFIQIVLKTSQTDIILKLNHSSCMHNVVRIDQEVLCMIQVHYLHIILDLAYMSQWHIWH